MRLTEDDGSLIEIIPDDCAVLVLRPDAEPDLFTPVLGENEEVPDHVLLAGATLNALASDHGRTQLMAHLPPKPSQRN